MLNSCKREYFLFLNEESKKKRLRRLQSFLESDKKEKRKRTKMRVVLILLVLASVLNENHNMCEAVQLFDAQTLVDGEKQSIKQEIKILQREKQLLEEKVKDKLQNQVEELNKQFDSLTELAKASDSGKENSLSPPPIGPTEAPTGSVTSAPILPPPFGNATSAPTPSGSATVAPSVPPSTNITNSPTTATDEIVSVLEKTNDLFGSMNETLARIADTMEAKM